MQHRRPLEGRIPDGEMTAKMNRDVGRQVFPTIIARENILHGRSGQI